MAHTDDTRQLTALAIAETRADIICLQEVDNIEALKAFEYGYLFKMIGEGYRQKYTSTGNDSRGIDVARHDARRNPPRPEDRVRAHDQPCRASTFEEFGLHTPELDSARHPAIRAHLPPRLPGDRPAPSAASRSPSMRCISSRWAGRATTCRAATRPCRCGLPRRRRCGASSRTASARISQPTSAG